MLTGWFTGGHGQAWKRQRKFLLWVVDSNKNPQPSCQTSSGPWLECDASGGPAPSRLGTSLPPDTINMSMVPRLFGAKGHLQVHDKLPSEPSPPPPSISPMLIGTQSPEETEAEGG